MGVIGATVVDQKYTEGEKRPRQGKDNREKNCIVIIDNNR